VVSSEDLELLQRYHISPRTRSKLVGNGVDLTRFNPARFDAEARQRIRESIGVKEDQIVVGVVGRLVAEKGYLELFEAAKMLDDRYAVLAIGPCDPEKTDALPERILNEAQAAGVRFLGMRDDIAELHAALDIFVLPSHREGLPIAAIEATASGLPIIATDIRGCRQVVDHDRNGLLIPVRNAKALAAAIKRLGDDPKMRSRMGQAGREKAEAEYDERQVVETVMDAYREVARRKGLPSMSEVD
jgi:glycosyltransferase involved in cell wall biosynthesis